jgi:chromosome segregation ATPase
MYVISTSILNVYILTIYEVQRTYERLQIAEDLLAKLGTADLQKELQLALLNKHRRTEKVKEQEDKIESLEETVSLLDTKLRESIKESNNLKMAVAKLTTKLNTQTEEYQHKNKSIELLNDELLSMQIQNTLLYDKVEKLERENDQLVQRWLEKVQQDADKINAILEQQ